MELHYILVVLIILAIIVAQIYIYRNTQKKITTYKSIFPSNTLSYSIIEREIRFDNNVDDEERDIEEIETITVSQLNINTNNNTLKEIRNALNAYLQKNKGAASDFYLMKDVVERYCDAEEEINIQQPIPLYLGLMGTMVGIIVGIGFIAVSGGLSSESLMDNITSLMTCVAIAMAASLVGICCTTMISWSSKSATSKVEADKNRFYSWLQTKLLPVLSGNAVNALYLLQQNLMSFNQTFQSNIEGLDSALSKVEDSSREQIELITLIKDIDIKRVAQANVSVLKELKECTGEITVFNKYLHSVSGYLTAVNELNGNINEHLNRTAAIENMGAFFEREISQVTAREQYINEVVAKVDDTLRKTFERLTESTKDSVTQLRNNSITEFDALLKHYSEQKEEFAKMMQEQRDEFADRNAETLELMKEIRNLADIKTVMGQLVESTKGQNAMLEQLVRSIQLQDSSNHVADNMLNNNIPTIEAPKFPESIVYMVATITLIVVMAFGLYIYNSFIAEPQIGVVSMPQHQPEFVNIGDNSSNTVQGQVYNTDDATTNPTQEQSAATTTNTSKATQQGNLNQQ